eukprot:TRINITY_DN31722_c0_g1_i1.p1 TRINITY_DN31722_c0_g1~~TRINITY_DN31722_c0_g1_i1.p1  ORF type:complete len:382 (+),score=61.74 TRINITY_DN31722_c0_g1_i1:101-1147(+)
MGFVTICTGNFFLVLYEYCFVRSLRAGFPRFQASLPAFLWFLWAPNYVFARETHSAWIILMTAFLSFWATFKLFAFCLGRGQLTNITSFVAFTCGLLFPIRVQTAEDLKQGTRFQQQWTWQKLFASCLIKVFVATALVATYVAVDIMWVRRLLFPVGIYVIASLMMDGVSGFANVCGVPVMTHFNEPYMASSVNDFWSNRWNLTASSVLRDAVYYPVMSLYNVLHSYNDGAASDGKARPARRIPQWWRMVAVLAAFTASGVMHELMVYNSHGVATYHWLAFFVLHGVVCIAETAFNRRFPNAVPSWLGRLMLYVFMLVSADCLFLEPLFQDKWGTKMVVEFYSLLEFL